MVRLSQTPDLAGDGARLLEEYFRLPDAWEWQGGVPEELPAALADAVASYPGSARPPAGEVFLVAEDDELAAQVMLAPHDEVTGRIERLYVRPPYRRQHIADALVLALVRLARSRGYQKLVLNVMPHREAAIRLYQRHGFRPVEPFATYRMPLVYLGRDVERDPEHRSPEVKGPAERTGTPPL